MQAILGTRVPPGLKVVLLALAIIDDLGAIPIIAIFYTADLSFASLAATAAAAAVLATLSVAGVKRLLPFALVGVVMWVTVLKSGAHATLAGVAVAFLVPLCTGNASETLPPVRAERALYGFVALFVMPVFAFANAGVKLGGLSFADPVSPLPPGIAAGLFIGKQIGVFGFVRAGVRLGWCQLPNGVTWQHVYGAAALAGFGFTMRLFIGSLAFSDPEHQALVRLGVHTGSVFSGVVGCATLRWLVADSGSSRPATQALHRNPRRPTRICRRCAVAVERSALPAESRFGMAEMPRCGRAMSPSENRLPGNSRSERARDAPERSPRQAVAAELAAGPYLARPPSRSARIIPDRTSSTLIRIIAPCLAQFRTE